MQQKFCEFQPRIFMISPLPEEWSADADVALDGEGDRGKGGAGQRHLRDGHQEWNEVEEDIGWNEMERRV